MRSSQMRRRVLALAALTSVAVVTGSIAVADGPNVDDITADALASSPALTDVLPSDVDVDEVVTRARAVREPLIPDRSVAQPTETPTPEPTAESAGSEATATDRPDPADQSDARTWVASWYGPNFHGNLTANGEVYDQWGITAAHKSLPFGTEVRVTNPSTGRSVVVRINDRGPFIEGRDIDLSRGAAEAIGVTGVATVQVEIL